MIEVAGKPIQVRGSVLRLARLDAEKFFFLDDPEPVIEGLRRSDERIDMFTFIQKVTERTPKYSYFMEWDNLAVLPISTFNNWWEKQIGFKARNKAKQAEKRGVVTREVPFSEELVRGICDIYNETPIRQGRKFSHFGKDLRTVYQEEATYLDRSVFLGAYLDGKLIGFTKILWDSDRSQRSTQHRLADRTTRQGAEQRTGRARREVLRRAEDSLSCLFELRLWEKEERFPQRLQGAEWF